MLRLVTRDGGTPTVGCAMRNESDFTKMKGKRNPYAKKPKKQVIIRLSEDVIGYTQ